MIITYPTSRAQWYHLYDEAKTISGYVFDQDIELYVIATLESMTATKYWHEPFFATEYLALQQRSFAKARNLADHCLIISGLFPGRIQRRFVSLSYLTQIGQQSYLTAAYKTDSQATLFLALSQHFTGLADLLSAMRRCHYAGSH